MSLSNKFFVRQVFYVFWYCVLQTCLEGVVAKKMGLTKTLFSQPHSRHKQSLFASQNRRESLYIAI